MIDPVSILKPTSSVSPIPSVVPDLPTYESVGETGSKTLWVVFAIMFLSTLGFIAMAWTVPVQKRLYHVITAAITTIATLSYFAMATGEAVSYADIAIKEVHNHTPDTIHHVMRQVFWGRYVDWTFTTPLLLLDLAFLAGLSGADILVAIFADVIMILTGLFAAFGKSEGSKWGWYGMACVAYLVVVYLLAVNGRRTVMSKDSQTAKLFGAIGGFTLILWTLYPVVWGIADGARIWSVDTEIVAYAILDVLAKPVFGYWLLFTHAKRVSSVEGFWSSGLGGEGGVRLDDDA